MTNAKSNLLFDLPQEEIWITIEDFPDYEISSFGRVRRRTKYKRYHAGYILSPGDVDGYLHVSLTTNKQRKQFYVHQLVAKAFLKPREPGQFHVNHKDGIRSNNSPHNLEWATPLQNQRHAIETLGADNSGERHFNVRLTFSDLKQLCELRASGKSASEIAAVLGVTSSCVVGIFTGKTRKKEMAALGFVYQPLPHIGRVGSSNSQAVLTEESVREIKALLRQNLTGREIARRFGVHPQTISNIKTGRIWIHVKEDSPAAPATPAEPHTEPAG